MNAMNTVTITNKYGIEKTFNCSNYNEVINLVKTLDEHIDFFEEKLKKIQK